MSEEGSAKGRKRKRSIQDVPINMNKMRKMLETFKTLKDELYDIDETEIELGLVKQHLDSLETILRDVKKLKLNFSSLTLEDLREIGVGDGLLDIDLEVISGRVSAKMQEPIFQAACTDLSREMVDIYTHVNMQYEAGARMILDAVFKALWKLQEVPKTLDHEGITVSLIPEFKLPKEGVKITNGEYEVWLSGSVDYCVARYLATERNMELVLKLNSNTTESRLRIALNLTDHQLFLVEAKHAGRTSLEDYVPEAVGQALALCTFLRHDVMRFILADGVEWLFYILRKEEDQFVYYQSLVFQLPKETLCTSSDISRILFLLTEWLKPSENFSDFVTFTSS